jgi:hypothetical protein
VLWLLEPDIFAVGTHPLERAALDAGHNVRLWSDDWWRPESLPEMPGPVLFHGSLANAARIAATAPWWPGAFCNTAAFHCSLWYPDATKWLVHTSFMVTTVEQLTADPELVAGALRNPEGEVFVRPDSPLKPFSGRVVKLSGLTAAQLDHGFYYDNLDLPIVVSAKQSLGREWRFVICDGVVVGSSAYEAAGRKTSEAPIPGGAVALAEEIAAAVSAPDPVYVIDVVESESGLRLLEINPFSGADLYACDTAAIVTAVASLLSRQ